MKFLIILPVILFSITSCSKKNSLFVEPMKPNLGLTYLALGDSYTVGQSVSENLSFPFQLTDSLNAVNLQISTTKIIARTGWTTDELNQAIDVSGLTDSTKFDMVTLLIGVNNQYRGRSVETYKPEFKDLLIRAIKFAGGKTTRVFVVSIPDYAYTPFGGGRTSISHGIDEYNAANEAITESMGIAYINITPISREGLNDPSLITTDGLHPSGKQYSKWVHLILPLVIKSFQK